MAYSHDFSSLDLNNLPMFNPLNENARVPKQIITQSFLQAQDLNNYPSTQNLSNFKTIKPGYGSYEANSSKPYLYI